MRCTGKNCQQSRHNNQIQSNTCKSPTLKTVWGFCFLWGDVARFIITAICPLEYKDNYGVIGHTKNMSTLTIYEVGSIPTITTQSDLEGATIILSELNRKLDTLKEEREKVTKPLNEALKAERARFKPYEDKLTEAVATIKAGMAGFITRQEEERARALKELQAGKVDAVQAVATMAENNSTGAKTESGSVSFVEVKAWRVIDESKIPREFLQVNEAKIKEAMKAGTPVEGIEYYLEKQIRNRR